MEALTMAKDDRTQNGILGDINPQPGSGSSSDRTSRRGDRDAESITGSEEDRAEHSGTRDVTEGVTGGAGTKVGGTRNYRQGSGAAGTDIGNRPE
jgi:hypothetical protein